MTDTGLSTEPAARSRSAPGKVTGRLLKAVVGMVWQGWTDNEAAVQTGMTVTAIRLAMRRAHVRAYYHDQLQVRRERESARNIHRWAEIRDAADNQAAVNAGKAIEQLSDANERQHSPLQQSPGLVIVVQGASHALPKSADVVDVTPIPSKHDD